jgi:hypothetical protein
MRLPVARNCLLAVLLTGLVGCGEREIYQVTGTVKLTDGTPLPGGRVILTGGASGAHGQIGEDGSFTLGTYRVNDGARPGEYAVAATMAVRAGWPRYTENALTCPFHAAPWLKNSHCGDRIDDDEPSFRGFAARDRRVCRRQFLCTAEEGAAMVVGEFLVGDGTGGLVGRALDCRADHDARPVRCAGIQPCQSVWGLCIALSDCCGAWAT